MCWSPKDLGVAKRPAGHCFGLDAHVPIVVEGKMSVEFVMGERGEVEKEIMSAIESLLEKLDRRGIFAIILADRPMCVQSTWVAM